MNIKQQGVALISVLLIVALASILATKMTAKLMLQMQRTANISSNQQAYWYALGAEAFAKGVLIETFKDEADVTHLDQFWAQGETSYPVENGQIVGEIIDMQACFNINALRAKAEADNGQGNTPKKSAARTSFEALIVALNIENVDEFSAEYLADALTDFVDEDDLIVSAGGAEDSDYSSKVHPYLAANNFLSTVSELRVVEHFTPDVINALKGYICALPNNGLHQVNINTISDEHPELLQGLLGVNKTDAENILADRKSDYFKSVEEFFALPSLKNKQITEQQKNQFTVDSQFFKLKTTASFNNSYVNLQSIFQVSKNNRLDVISRSIGRE